LTDPAVVLTPRERPVVGHVTRSFLPRSETFTYTQIRSLRRYNPVVLTWLTENRQEFPGVSVVEVTPPARLPTRVRRKAVSLMAGTGDPFEHRLAAAAVQSGCRLLHAHFGWTGVASLYAQQQTQLPLVTTFHARDIVTERQDLIAGYPRLFERGALFTAVGPTMAALLEQRGCPGDRIRIVKLGIDVTRIEFRPREPGTPFVLLQIGRLVSKKGFEVALRAYASVRRELRDSEFWIVGDGPLRDRLVELTDRLDLTKSVHFLGALDHNSTIELMQRADVGLQPSLTAADGDMEGTPTVLLEMQASGLPVVATNHADVASIVRHPEHLVGEGSAEQLAQEILRVARLSGPERRQAAEAARRFVVSEHNIPRAREAIESVYDEALSRTQ
jgi:colanic acid/amylovoran/stewartan biosynthesis glycosyltransferase WcaL/AmsK/CpsK